MTMEPLEPVAQSHGGLREVSPGVYVDKIGNEYFYLTGMYASIAHLSLNEPLLNTPVFISKVLRTFRSVYERMGSTELMD